MFLVKAFFWLVRVFIKITGIIPYLLFIKPRYVYASVEAKHDFKHQRKGVLYIPNHSSINDYYVFVFKCFFSNVHTFVADCVWKKPMMRFLNHVMGNIEIKRTGEYNISAIQKANDLLKKKKKVLIFPEGKVEAKKGKLEDFTNTFMAIAIRNNVPIIPFYFDGYYGLFKRPIVVVGEMIKPTAIAKYEDIPEDLLNNKTKEVATYIKKLGTIARDSRKYKTQKLIKWKCWFLDWCKIGSIPFFYFIFPTKKYYFGNKKAIKKNISKRYKYNVIFCPNHCGPCDVMYLYMHVFSRRVRVMTADVAYKHPLMRFCLNSGDAIKIRRDSMNGMDLVGFKETIDTLNGRGAVAIFPEGHINFDGKMDESFKEGAATISLMTNSPIVPIIFATPYMCFHFNKVIIGDVIYPHEVLGDNYLVNASTIKQYNDYFYAKMRELYEFGITKRPKNFAKKIYFKDSKKKEGK